MKTYPFYLPEKMIEKLKQLKEQTGISISEHVRNAITAYLKKNLMEEK